MNISEICDYVHSNFNIVLFFKWRSFDYNDSIEYLKQKFLELWLTRKNLTINPFSPKIRKKWQKREQSIPISHTRLLITFQKI